MRSPLQDWSEPSSGSVSFVTVPDVFRDQPVLTGKLVRLAILCVPNSDVDLEFWLTLSPRWCSLDLDHILLQPLMHKASMSRRATGLALTSRDFSAVRAVRTTEAGCQPGET